MSKSINTHVPKPKRNGSGKIVKVQKTVSHGSLIVVKENQTVRGVKMSEQLTNIIKILLVTFILLFIME